jgi:hypothetical protein
MEVRSENRTPTGGMAAPDGWNVVPEYKDIPCRYVDRHGVEPRYLWGQAENDPILIALNGRHSGIDAAKMRAHVSDGKIFNITSVAGDSDGAYTVLVCRDYKPTVDAGL